MLWALLTLSLTPVGHAAPAEAPAALGTQTDDAVCAATDRTPECGPGVWLGPLAICESGLVTTRLLNDEYSGLPVLIIDLDGRLRDALAKLTADRVGQPLPLRIDGRTLIAPVVNEPIVAGSLQVSGPDMPELERLRLALQRCSRPTETSA